MNTSLLPYVGAYIGGQLAGITLVAIVAKKVMPSNKPYNSGAPIVGNVDLPCSVELSFLYK